MKVFSRMKSIALASLGSLVLGAFANLAEAQERTVMVTLVQDSRKTVGNEWRFSTSDPGADWNLPSFDASSWLTSYAGFGTGNVLASHINTDWSAADIWMRQSFNVADPDFESLVLSYHHDDDMEVYLNGIEVFQESGFTNDYTEATLAADFKAALKAGANVIAVHCHNNDGPGYIDVGLAGLRTMQATSIIGDARNFPEEWKYSNSVADAAWYQPSFADADWTAGLSGFGSTEYAAYVGTPWTSSDIWLRKTFTLDKAYDDYILAYQHDDDMEIYVNGTQLVQESGYLTEYKEAQPAGLAGALVVGANTIAVHCGNAGSGGQFIDMSLVGLTKPQPVGVRKGLAGKNRPAFSRVLYARGSRGAGPQAGLDLTGFPALHAGTLSIYGLDGGLRAALRPAGLAFPALPPNLGTGTFRYLWRSPLGSGQGVLITFP